MNNLLKPTFNKTTVFRDTLHKLNDCDKKVVNNHLRQRLINKYKDPVLETVKFDALEKLDYIDIMYSGCTNNPEMMISCRNRMIALLEEDDRLTNLLEIIATEKGVLKEFKE